MNLRVIARVACLSIIINLPLYFLVHTPRNVIEIKTVEKILNLREHSYIDRLLKPAEQNVSEVTIPLHPCSCKRTVNSTWGRNNSQLVITANSTCSEWATARGLKQQVLSYTLYGKFNSAYRGGIEKLVPLVAEIYPGWTMRVYHDHLQWEDKRRRLWACSLACKFNHLDFCDISNIPDVEDTTNINNMIWRTYVLGDQTVDRFLIRDADTPILQREADAVAEWIASGKKFHVMRDHRNHRSLIMGGMWGCWNGKDPENLEVLKEVRGKLIESIRTSEKDDQMILNEHVWPHVLADGMQHDSYRCLFNPGSHPFPSQRNGWEFVGMITYRNRKSKIGGHSCPVECRPKDHQDWKWC